MDAAHCINTLETRAGRAAAPLTFDFAILDLAQDEDLLARIYATMAREPLAWVSLFEGTDWQEHWRDGPVLVDARQTPGFQRGMVGRLHESPSGLLLKTPHVMDALRTHLARWIHQAPPGRDGLVRIHEPRMFGPLLCTLASNQQEALLQVASHWHWHDSHTWRTASPAEHAAGAGLPLHPQLQSWQFQAATPYRLAAEAIGHAQHYQRALAHLPDPEAWVLERLQEARNAGFATTRQLERWLRLAIRQGADFHTKAPYSGLLAREELSRNDQLDAMEGAAETYHAPA